MKKCLKSAVNLQGFLTEVSSTLALLSHSMQFVSDGELRCYENMIDRHLRRGSCGESLAKPATVNFLTLVCHLETPSFADRLAVSSSSSSSGPQQVGAGSDRGGGWSAPVREPAPRPHRLCALPADAHRSGPL